MHRVALLLLAAVAACGGDGGCPLVGCVSQLTVALPPGTASARACVSDVCAVDVVDGVLQVPLSRRVDGSSVAVVVELVDGGGATSTVTGDAALRTTRPNGARCPPTCISASVRVQADGSLVDLGPPPAPSGS